MHRVSIKKIYFLPLAGIIMLAVFFVAQEVYAGVLDDLKKSIEEKNAEIRKLEEDAQKYRLELSNKQQIGKTLKQELSRIQINIKKLQNDIGITQQQVKRAELQITELSYEISEREQSIKRIKKGLGSLLTLFYETERNSNIQIFNVSQRFLNFFKY